jgi:hypothetical protein
MLNIIFVKSDMSGPSATAGKRLNIIFVKSVLLRPSATARKRLNIIVLRSVLPGPSATAKHGQCWGSVTFCCGSGSPDPYVLTNGSGSHSFLH